MAQPLNPAYSSPQISIREQPPLCRRSPTCCELVYQDGQRLRQEPYHNGRPHGRWVQYEPQSGVVLESREFQHGKLHGTVTVSHPNGRPKKYATYESGQLHGLHKTWHANGKLATDESFVHGKRHGRSAAWNLRGELQLDLQYDNDELISKR